MMRMLKTRWILIATITLALASALPAAGDSACLDYQSLQIAPLGIFDLTEGANDVAVDGHLALLAGTGGVRILDITEPDAPLEQGTLPETGPGSGVALAGNLAVATRSDSQLVFFGIETPAAPIILASLELEGEIRHIDMHQDRVLVVTYSNSIDPASRLYLIDSGDPGVPVLDASLEFSGRAVDVESDEGHAYVSLSGEGVAIVDLHLPHALEVVGNIPTETGVHGLALASDRLFVTDGSLGLRIFDVVDPAHPQPLGTLPLADPLDVAVAGSRALISRAPDVYVLVDVATPGQPRIVGSYGGAPAGVGCRVVADASLFLVADYHQGLRLVGLGPESAQPSLPYHGLDDYYVAGARDGSLAAIRKDNGTGWTLLDLSGESIVPIVEVPTSSAPRSLLLAGERLYTSDESRQLRTYSVADPATPILLGTGSEYFEATLMGERQGLLLVGLPSHPLTVLDMSNPEAPSEVASPITNPGSQVCSWALAGDLIWVKVYGGDIYCFGIADPAHPQFLSMITADAHGGHLAASGTVLYLTSWDAGLEIFDFQAPASPEFLTQWFSPVTDASAIVSDNDHLYLANLYSGIRCLDVSDPQNPRDLGSFATRDYAAGFLAAARNSSLPLLALGGHTLEAIPLQCSFSSGVEDQPHAAGGLTLSVYPNPFNPRCTVQLAIESPDVLDVAIYDLSGRRVSSLASRRAFEAGNHQLVWNGSDDHGRSVPSGQYIALIMGNRFRGGQKLLLLR